MLWTHECIDAIVDRLIAGSQRAYAREALQEMRDEYEEQRSNDANEWNARLAELEAELRQLREQEAARF